MKRPRKGRPTALQSLITQMQAQARAQAEAEVVRELKRAFRVALKRVAA